MYGTTVKATYVCCICQNTTSTRYECLEDFRDETLRSDQDLGRYCRGGCGHRRCVKCRSSVEGLTISCWVCGPKGNDVVMRYVVRGCGDSRTAELYVDERNVERCRKCGYYKGSDSITGWAALPWICEELGACWFGVKKQGERGHFCKQPDYYPEVQFMELGYNYEISRLGGDDAVI